LLNYIEFGLFEIWSGGQASDVGGYNYPIPIGRDGDPASKVVAWTSANGA